MKTRKTLWKILCIAVTVFLCESNAEAQSREAFSFNSKITPAAETYTISRYGNISPSLYTGTMSYSLPIYTYTDNDFTIPVSLDYNFSGYRPAVHSGAVGYGWALNCGGVITREIIGIADDARNIEDDYFGYYMALESGLFNYDFEIANSKQYYLQHHIGTEEELSNVNLFSDRPEYVRTGSLSGYDTCPDIFHFSFLGCTGDFMLTQDGTIKVFNTNRPSGEFCIECTFTDCEPKEDFLSEIRIKTGDGFCYHFGGGCDDVEFSRSSTESSASPFTVSGWKLRKITAPNGNTAEFIYDVHQKDISLFESYTPMIDADAISLDGIFGENAYSETLTYACCTYHSLPSEIRINGDRSICFTYTEKDVYENTQDCFLHSLPAMQHGYFSYTVDEKRLSSIKIINSQGLTVDEVNLEQVHTEDNGGAPRMFLKKVQSRHNGSHSFEYDLNSSALPHNDSFETDHWGYWNGQSTARSLKNHIINPTEANPVPDLYNQLNDKEVKKADKTHSQKGGLTRIIYPTGGRSDIFYEAHNVDYLYDTHGFPANTISLIPGGVRLSKIVNCSEEITDSTVYKYSNGILMYMPRYALHLKYMYHTTIQDPFDPTVNAYVDAGITSIGYTDECSPISLRDPAVTYTSVATEYPDGSVIEQEYYSALDKSDAKEIGYESSSQEYKYVKVYDKAQYFSPSTYVYTGSDSSDKEYIRELFMPYTSDYSRIRGKIKSTKEYDSKNCLKKSVYYDYGIDQMRPVHTQTMVYNTLLDFTEAPLNIYASLLRKEIHKTFYENGEKCETISYSYNDDGQIIGIVRDTGNLSESEHIRYYRDIHKDYTGDTLKSAISAIIYMKSDRNGISYLTGGITNHYDDTGNPQPTRKEFHSSDKPVIASTISFEIPEDYDTKYATFIYDEHTQRLIREEYPGGIYHAYVWDDAGRNILSKESNDPINITRYSWKDLVGPTEITHPSQAVSYYFYDSSNRLESQQDTDTDTEKKFRYHLINP